MTAPDFSNADEEVQARCLAVAKVDDQRYLCELPYGHTGSHRNSVPPVAWLDGDPVDDPTARTTYANP